MNYEIQKLLDTLRTDDFHEIGDAAIDIEMLAKKDRKCERDTKNAAIGEHNKKGKTHVQNSGYGSMNQSRPNRYTRGGSQPNLSIASAPT